MELNIVQKEAVAKWVAEKRSIGEIQKLLAQEYKLSLTYMDVRFLLIDLGLTPKDKETKPAKPTELMGAGRRPDEMGGEADLSGGLGEPTSGRVSVAIDRIMKPGALVSGTVKFSDGVTATWMLDQLGRLAMEAGKKGYRPSQDDLQAFQTEVSRELQKHGF